MKKHLSLFWVGVPVLVLWISAFLLRNYSYWERHDSWWYHPYEFTEATLFVLSGMWAMHRIFKAYGIR